MKHRREKEWFDDNSLWRCLYPFLAQRSRAADTDIEKVLALIKPKGKQVLDLGCGLGRHALALAKRGFNVTGVDRTRFYLDQARTLAESAGLHVEWVQMDMRDFVQAGVYDVALCLLSSFGYFKNKEDDLGVLRNLFVNLKPGGWCLIDVAGKEVLARIAQPTTSDVLPDGTLFVQRHEIVEDWTSIQNQWSFIVRGRARTFEFRHRIYSGQELREAIAEAGFSDIRLYGCLDGAGYGADAERLIAVGRKRR